MTDKEKQDAKLAQFEGRLFYGKPIIDFGDGAGNLSRQTLCFPYQQKREQWVS